MFNVRPTGTVFSRQSRIGGRVANVDQFGFIHVHSQPGTKECSAWLSRLAWACCCVTVLLNHKALFLDIHSSRSGLHLPISNREEQEERQKTSLLDYTVDLKHSDIQPA